MKLIDLLVKKTNEEGWSWPRGALGAHWIKSIKKVAFIDSDGYIPMHIIMHQFHDIDSDETETLVTKSQYESALAASEGWIEWGGGSIPVNGDCVVDVKFRIGQVESSMPARYWTWTTSHRPGDIIAYRLHKPDINSRANDDRLEQDLNECIGQDVDMPEWSGDGLPPVDCQCEFSWAGEDFRGGILRYASWQTLVIESQGVEGSYCISDVKFRPLRTEEEKARNAAIGAMERAWEDAMNKPAQNFELIYDTIAAGKIPGVKLEVK